jgi:hypothetical protein
MPTLLKCNTRGCSDPRLFLKVGDLCPDIFYQSFGSLCVFKPVINQGHFLTEAIDFQ